MDKIELLDGMINANPIIMVLDILVLIHFVYSWYKSYKKTGWKIDVWHYGIFMGYIIPFVLIYPFNSSELNVFATGSAYIEIGKYVEEAWFITLIGYICMLLGKWLYDANKHQFNNFNLMEKIVLSNIKHSFGIRVLSLTCISFFFLIAVISIFSDMIFNARGWILTHPSYRALGNFFSSIYPLAFIYLGFRILNNISDKKDKIILILMCGAAVFWGSRGMLLGPIVTLIIMWYYLHYERSIKYILLASILILVGAMTLAIMRASGGMEIDNSNDTNFVLFGILYGNSFSDCRDFAWMLTGLNDAFYYGKTYISGMLSFLPSYLFPFRRENALGAVSLEIANIANPTGEHPGIRGGSFAEAYINFYYVGVVFLGIIKGYYLQMANKGMMYYAGVEKDVVKGYISGIPDMIVGYFSNTAGMFGLYVFFVFHIITLLSNVFVKYLNMPSKRSTS